MEELKEGARRERARLVEGYRVLGLVRFFDVGRERVACTSHPINLDPRFQIRFCSPPSVARSGQTARIYTSSASCRLKAASSMALAGAASKY